MLKMFLLALGGLTLTAQTQIDLRTQAKHIDFTAADSTRPIKTGTALPATCVQGDMFFKTDAPAGANLYGCTAANTWSVQGGISSANCQYDAASGTLRCTDARGNVYATVETATNGTPNQWVDYIAPTGIPHPSQPTAAAVGAVADPGSNGIPYRNGSGTAAPASANEMSGPFFCQDPGAGNGYASNRNPPISSYGTGTSYWFKAGAANTGAATINFNALGPKTIVKQYNQALGANDIQAGQWVIVTDDGTNMQMQSQTADAPQGAVPSVFGRTGPVTAQSGDYTTAQVTESGNLYFTNGRARAALAGGGPITFNSSSGVMDCLGCVTTATTADTDLNGSFPHLSVVGVQGRPVASTPPTDQQYLGWNGGVGRWEPKTLPGAPVTSMFGRTGTIAAQNGDYAFSQIAGTVSASQLPGVAMRTDQDNAVTAGTQDFRNAAHTLPMKSGTVATLPGTCTAGETYFAMDAPAGGNVYGCTAPNTWSAQGSGQGNLTVKSGGFTVGTRGAANFVTGAGLMSTISDDGAEINIQSALDSAVIQTLPGEQSGSTLICASGSGSASQYTCALIPTLAAYTSGMVLHWKPDVAGAGGPTTLNVDTLGAKPLKMADGVSDPASSDISAGKLYNVWYDGGGVRLMATTGTTGGGAITIVFGRTGPVSAQSGDYNTAQVAESGNLYFTNARVWSALGANGPITFNGATGTIACPTCLTTGTVLAAAQEPAHTGDMTNAAGSLATTVGKINGGAIPTDGKPVKRNGSGHLVDAVAGTDYQAPLAAATNAVAGIVTMSTATSSVAVATDDSRNTNSRTPTGSGSGDPSGTYRGPSVAKVSGTSVPSNSSADQVLGTTASATGGWMSVPNCPSGALQYSTSTYTFACGVSAPSLTIYTAGYLWAATYVSGLTGSGSGTCTATLNSGYGGTLGVATFAVTSGVIGVTGTVTAPGSGYTSAPVGVTGSGACSGGSGVIGPTLGNTITTGGGHFNAVAVAMAFVLPTPTNTLRVCVGNSTGVSNIVTFKAPASTYIDYLGINGSAAGTFVSTGLLGDYGCLYGMSGTNYKAFPVVGSWGNN